jgi:glucosyl-dolichyl phosphate glucuronosyltransferase
MAMPSVSVVISAVNEERNIPRLFAQLPSDIHQVILVDGCSADATVATARALRPDVQVVAQPPGSRRQALTCGFAAATGDIIATIDADGSADPAELPRFVEALISGADLAKGTRAAGGGGSSKSTLLRMFGNLVLTKLFNAIYGRRYSDLCCGFNVFWRRHVPVLRLDEVAAGRDRRDVDAYEVTSLIHVRAAQAGLVVAEVPSDGGQRRRGVSNLTAFEEGRRVLRAIVRERYRARRPVAPGGAETASALVPAQRPAPDQLGSATAGDVALLPTVSVVIAAYALERWNDLRRAVASVHGQAAPVLETIVVVDHQPELLARARRELPGVTVLANQGVPGASAARNTGVAASRGEIVAFLDDDAVASPNWLAPLLGYFTDPAVVGVGGRMDPLWATSRPYWFPPEFDWAVGASYTGMPTRPAVVRNVWSNNMAIRRQVFDLAGGFRDDMAKVGKRSRPEDTDLCLRATEACPSGRWMYEPAGAAGHRVPAERATVRYFAYRCFYEGQGKAALASLNGVGKSISTEQAYARQVLPAGVLRGLADMFRGDLSGGLRSVAIVAGFTMVLTGFLAGQLPLLVRPLRSAASSSVASTPAAGASPAGHRSRPGRRTPAPEPAAAEPSSAGPV